DNSLLLVGGGFLGDVQAVAAAEEHQRLTLVRQHSGAENLIRTITWSPQSIRSTIRSVRIGAPATSVAISISAYQSPSPSRRSARQAPGRGPGCSRRMRPPAGYAGRSETSTRPGAEPSAGPARPTRAALVEQDDPADFGRMSYGYHGVRRRGHRAP